MQITNGKGEKSLTPSSQVKEDARSKLKELKSKGKPKSIAELTARVEEIEKILGL